MSLQCCNQTNGKTTCIIFSINYFWPQILNQFTLQKLTDWGYNKSLLHTLFVLLWWTKMSPPQASPVSSLCMMLHSYLIDSSQIAWQNSEATANTELLWLFSSRDNPWRERWGCYYGDMRSRHSLVSHLRTVTFLDLYSNRDVSWSVCPYAEWESSPQGLMQRVV